MVRLRNDRLAPCERTDQDPWRLLDDCVTHVLQALVRETAHDMMSECDAIVDGVVQAEIGASA